MYAKMLKRRLQEAGGKEDDPFSTNRYLAERMAEDMLEKARISPLKKPKVAPTAPEDMRRPKRPRPFVDPWARDLQFTEYDPKRLTKVRRRSEEHTNVAMDFINAKLKKVAITDQHNDDNTCKALALYQPSPFQRLTNPDTVVKVHSEAVLSSLSSVSDLKARSRFPLPVTDLSKAIILYPVPENTIRDALRRLVTKGEERAKNSLMECESCPRIEEIFDDDPVDEEEEEEEEEGDGLMVTDRSPPHYFGNDGLRIEELHEYHADEEEEEEEEEEEGDGMRRGFTPYRVTVPGGDNLIYEDDYSTTPATDLFTQRERPWYSMAPPPTPLATSFSSAAPYLSQPPFSNSTDSKHTNNNNNNSADMTDFLSRVNGKLLNEQQQSSASCEPPLPFNNNPCQPYTWCGTY